jgi:hypothetical protein
LLWNFRFRKGMARHATDLSGESHEAMIATGVIIAQARRACKMIVSHEEIRARIEQLRLNCEGYRRQIAHLDLSPERRQRLENEVHLLEEEITTLEKIAQLGRVEPDRGKIEALVVERLETVRSSLAALPPDQHESASGEVKALLWALGQDRLTLSMRQLALNRLRPNPHQTDRTVAATIIHNLRAGPDPETRAGAAYEAGKLQIAEALPHLVAALGDHRLVADVALEALACFADHQLRAAGVAEDTLARIRARRPPAG